jgi:predicted phage tail protein
VIRLEPGWPDRTRHPATGLANIATVNVPGPLFSYSPVPNGFYFLRVRSRNAAGVSVPSAEVMINVGNVPAPPGPPNFSGYSVSAGTVTLNWQPPAQGTPTSYVIEAGSATGLSNLAVFNTGSTGLTQSFSGVPSGTYYVRVRAVNAQGASIASNERTLIVP